MKLRLLSIVLLSAFSAPILGARPVDTTRKKALDHYRAGQEALFGEDWEKAEAEFKEAIRIDPLLVPAHYGLGQTYMSMKRYREAVMTYTRCREAFHEETATALMDAVEWEKRLDDQIRAMEDQLRALQAGRGRAATGGAAAVQNAAARLESQIELMKSRRQRGTKTADPTPPSISLALGSAHFRTGAMADAEREYRAALEVNPKLGEVHNNLAVVYMLTGRLEHAQKELELAEKSGFKVSPGLQHDLKKRMEVR